MYEAIHAVPDGSATVARYAATAAEYGFDGVVVRNHSTARTEYDASTVREASGIDVVDGVELQGDDPAVISGALGSDRHRTTIILVHGGRDAINRFAVNQPRVDVLAHPTRPGCNIDHVLVRTAAANGVRIEFDFSPVLHEQGGSRVRAIARLRKLRDLVEAFDTPYVVSTDPTSHLDMRTPRDLAGLGETIGFSENQIETGLSEWGRLAAENRDRLSDEYIGPGVHRGRWDE